MPEAALDGMNALLDLLHDVIWLGLCEALVRLPREVAREAEHRQCQYGEPEYAVGPQAWYDILVLG